MLKHNTKNFIRRCISNSVITFIFVTALIVAYDSPMFINRVTIAQIAIGIIIGVYIGFTTADFEIYLKRKKKNNESDI